MLYYPAAHEPLVETPWRPGHVRDAIAAIVRETESAFDEETLTWPVHPRDAEGEDEAPALTVYLGSAGTIWALHRLGSQRDWAGVVRELPARYRAAPDLAGSIPGIDGPHPSFWMGESGVLVVEELVAGASDQDRLAELVAANATAPEQELMWGAPGTMLAAHVLHERTGEPRWSELWDGSADALMEAWQEDGLWAQRLYGCERHFVGPVHGFAGNVFALAQGRDIAARAVAVATRLAARDDGLAQWPPVTEPAAVPSAELRTQFCHGAPGIVATLAALAPEDAAWTELLVAGGELTWRAGPLAKGANLCHGTGGNGYAFLKLLERTGDELWLGRARAFAMHCAEQVERCFEQHGRGRFPLWTGDPGTALYLQSCLDEDTQLPFFDRF